ncbi:MAG: EAL domain-containing protein [Vicinamibacteria bacterium]|nr:EAL domain-containing protein [Vicinamibacteria bacterium]
MSDNKIVPYYEHLPTLAAHLSEHGSLGAIVIDASALEFIEYEYGNAAAEEVRQRFYSVLKEHQGKDFRNGDLLASESPRGLRFLIFLERKRHRVTPFSPNDLKPVCTRLQGSLLSNLARAAFPYVKSTVKLDLVYGLALNNPLVHPELLIQRAVKEALELSAHQRQAEMMQGRERLQDLIVRERIVTAFQPILLLKDRTVLGFEALSRGGRGTGLEAADDLFGAAERHGLIVELDRLCRRRALQSSGRIPTNARLFVNTLPATIRDPQFRGKPLIDFLDKVQVSPDRIVVEITEKRVIDNFALFRETMAYYTDLGMSFAVDDVGAGYSGLELIARLKPHFLKIDTALVRDVHQSLVNRTMVKAIIAMGHGIGATVIAEGIHSQEETQALESMGVDFGQGFFLARPDTGE